MTQIARLGLLQALSYASLGAVFPYLALELRDRGIGGWALALALVSAPLLRLALGTTWGLAADRLGRVRPVVLLAGGLMVAGLVVLTPSCGSFIAVIGAVLLASGMAGITPLIDAASLRAVDHDSGRYAALRRWGSVGFLLAVLIAGALRDTLGMSTVVIGLAIAVGFVLGALTLPRAAPPDLVAPGAGLLRACMKPAPVLLLMASAAHFAGISLYDNFFAVHLDALGHGATWAGVAAVLGVGVEIGVFSIAGRLMARFGAPALLLTAMGINVPRWLLTAWLSTPELLVAVQVVHGFAFGAFWVAAVTILSRHVPRDLTGGAQGLLAAAMGGLGAGLGILLGSVIVETMASSWLFTTAAALAAAAVVLATACVLAERRPATLTQAG